MDDRARSREQHRAMTAEPIDQPAPGEIQPDAIGHAQEDEDAAAAARLRYRDAPLPSIQPDAVIARLLCPGERLLAVRRSATLDRRQHERSAGAGLVGDLYLTSARLIHVGRLSLAFPLQEIAEAVMAGDRLLLVMPGGTGISLDVQQPRLLRVEIATARAAVRR